MWRASRLLLSAATLRAAPPGAFARAPLLQKLDLSNVSIPFAPSGFLAPLVKLRELRWAKGGLTQIPDDVYHMVDLRILRLPDNKIFSLPADVARLTKLDELDLTNNDLSTLPAELGLLPLRSLGLEGNMLRMIRRPVIERGTQAGGGRVQLLHSELDPERLKARLVSSLEPEI